MELPTPTVLPTKTRAARLYGARDLRVEELDVPPVGPDEVMVAVAAVGVCGSDMHYYAAGRNGQNVLRQPTVLDHEASGVVIAAGATSGVQTGTRVAVEPAVGCGVCPSCRSGRYNICPYGTCLGSPPTNGTMSDYIVVPARAVHSLPAGIDTITGAMIEPLAVAVWAVQRAQVRIGQRVLITGAGPIGILVAQVARASVATEIVMTDVNDDRLAIATTFGVTRVINTAREELDIADMDRVLECSAVPRRCGGQSRQSGPVAASPWWARRPPRSTAFRWPICSATRSISSQRSDTRTPTRLPSRWLPAVPWISNESSLAVSSSMTRRRRSRPPSLTPVTSKSW